MCHITLKRTLVAASQGWRANVSRRFTFALAMAGLLSGCGGPIQLTADEQKAVDAMRSIAAAQQIFLAGGFYDANQDGLADYGTLSMLANPDGRRGVRPLIDPILTTERVGTYRLIMKVVSGTGLDAPPYWECLAIPFKEDYQRSFYIDNSGVVRFAKDGDRASKTSPVIPDPLPDA